MDNERALNDINLATARDHELAARKVLEQVTQALSMRTVTIAQIATSLLTNANPLAGTVRVAVKLATEILAEVENPTPEPKDDGATPERTIAGVKVPPIQKKPGQPVRIGWYESDSQSPNTHRS